jgi:pimeloyl-ACP methyl ester carboxylesterase
MLKITATMADPELDRAEHQLLAHYDLAARSRRITLTDPPLDVRVLEVGSGPPVLVVHGSGMTAATWAPLLAHLPDRHAFALDLPGFGASDPYDYSGRPLREHAVAQIVSALDALELDRAAIVGTSLGAMWALNAALAAPERVTAVVAFGMPAVSLPGLQRDTFFRLFTTPGVGRLLKHAPPPKSAVMARRSMKGALGDHAAAQMPDPFFDAIRLAMARPGWSTAMWTHLNLAMRRGRPRTENQFSEDEVRAIRVPTCFVWGDADTYGSPDVGRRAAELMPAGSFELVRGGHAPFLDEPARCAEIVRAMT